VLDNDCLDKIIERLKAIEDELCSGMASGDSLIQLSRDYAELSPIVEMINCVREYEANLNDLQEVLDDPSTDQEVLELAEEELPNLTKKLFASRQELAVMLIPKDEADEGNAILEIRAGTGGSEASLFVGDLFRMYSRYAQLQGWKVEIISDLPGEIGGNKEIIAEVSGRRVFHKLKFESGVHRVQRVPLTEASGRIHTSAATVAVLPEAKDTEIELNQSDLRFDTYRASGAGGQHVNKTDSAVRITHLPTGMAVAVQQERSQHSNKEKALKLLHAKLCEMEREKLQSDRATDRKSQVGSGDRSERIRTYNFPQGRVTDHRINLTWYKLNQIMLGEGLFEVIDALDLDHQAKLLAAKASGDR